MNTHTRQSRRWADGAGGADGAERLLCRAGRTRALLPLETFPGGVGVVDVSDPHQPQLLAALKFTEDHDTVYCACAAGDIIYAFAAKACQMVVLQSRLP
jgi:hypothetical protein